MAMNLLVPVNGIGKQIYGIQIEERVFDRATKTIGAGITAAQGGFFCYFSCPSRKVKEKNNINSE